MSGMPPVTAEEFERKTGAGEETKVLHIYQCIYRESSRWLLNLFLTVD